MTDRNEGMRMEGECVIVRLSSLWNPPVVQVSDAIVRLGDCRSRMLNVAYNNERMDEQVVRDSASQWGFKMKRASAGKRQEGILIHRSSDVSPVDLQIYLSSSLLPVDGKLSFQFFNVPVNRFIMRQMNPNRLAFLSPMLFASNKGHE